MKVRNIMIAMLVSVPSFVATSVIATDNPYEIEEQKVRAMAAEAAAQYEERNANPMLIFSLSENNNDGGPICQPWPYCF